MNPSVTFADIKIGKLFHVNGNDWEKRSTRTARMLSTGRTFYFSNAEQVHKIAM